MKRTGAAHHAKRLSWGAAKKAMLSDFELVDLKPFFSEDDLWMQDRNFKLALCREIKAGTENARIGVVKSLMMSRRTHFYPHNETRSAYGSPAAECSEL